MCFESRQAKIIDYVEAELGVYVVVVLNADIPSAWIRFLGRHPRCELPEPSIVGWEGALLARCQCFRFSQRAEEPYRHDMRGAWSDCWRIMVAVVV